MDEGTLEVDVALHDKLAELVRIQPQTLDWLTRRARAALRDARIDEQGVFETIERSTLLVPQYDGTIAHLRHVLDDVVLTHRARASLSGRRDLWVGLSMQPFLNLTVEAPIPLVGGGEVSRMHSGENVLVGPEGWLPDIGRYELVGVRLRSGEMEAVAVAEDDLPSPEAQQEARALIAGHYRQERWWRGTDDLESRPAELVRAIALAKMEDPGLFTTPYPPLDELLYNALEQEVDEHHWRDFASVKQGFTVSFQMQGMPEGLYIELNARARRYGMSFDQFVIALLSHLAFQTPFADDMEPWDSWDPDARTGRPSTLRSLPED